MPVCIGPGTTRRLLWQTKLSGLGDESGFDVCLCLVFKASTPAPNPCYLIPALSIFLHFPKISKDADIRKKIRPRAFCGVDSGSMFLFSDILNQQNKSKSNQHPPMFVLNLQTQIFFIPSSSLTQSSQLAVREQSQHLPVMGLPLAGHGRLSPDITFTIIDSIYVKWMR